MKKRSHKIVKGWLPKEAPTILPSNQRVRANPLNLKFDAVPARTLGGLGLGSLILGFPLLVAPYYLFPEQYVPKASGWGYTAPRTLEASLVLGAVLVLIFSAVFVCTLWGVKLKSQGSKSMKYTYWTTTQEGALPIKFYYRMAAAVNVFAGATFLGYLAFSNFAAQSIQSTVSLVAAFLVVTAVGNILLFEFFKKRARDQKERQKI